MKKIVAINASPRANWNTAQLVKEAGLGAKGQNAQVKVIDLYKLDKFTGCISCFGCKLPANLGKCICKDGLTDVLEEIRTADGLIIGSPNYLGDLSAGFRALYERLVFQYISYKKETPNYNERKIPVLLIMTSNADEDFYDKTGYTAMLENYKSTLGNFIGPVKLMTCGRTKQVNDYDRYNWTIFNPEEVTKRHETVWPMEKAKAFALGAKMVSGQWE
ncbi:MAG: flavodoxin family protein [Oscillospiraceae bacterium]|nr:flavodoxin family protein [Oscillospiraceae bacterium]